MKFWNRLEQNFKHKQLRFLEQLWGLQEIRAKDVDFSRIHRILVVRQHDQLGDFLLSTPVFRALRRGFPRAHIAVVARKYTAALVENNEYLDEIITFYENGSEWNFAAIKKYISYYRNKFDLAVVLNTVSHSLTSDLLARLMTRRFILGSEHHKFKGTTRNFFYNILAPYYNRARHQSERNLDIVRHLGLTCDSAREYMSITDDEKKWAEKFLKELRRDASTPLLAIHPGAGKMCNRWPVTYFAQVGNKLADRLDAQIFVTWGPKENDLGEELLKLLHMPAQRFVQSDIRKFAAFLSCMDLFLCNDTGVMHVAAAVGTPLVTVFGPTNPDEWKPVGDEFVALRAANGQCSSMKPDKVFKAALHLIERKLNGSI